MIQTALDFRKAEPWETITDSDVFAVQLSDGTLAYCIIMGNGGEHYALGYYEGARGLTSYLRSLKQDTTDKMAVSDLLSSMENLICEFNEGHELGDDEKRPIVDFLRAHELTAQPLHGWPQFKCYHPGKMPFSITKEQDADHIVEALKAATHMANLVKSSSIEAVGFDPEGEYITEDGGKDIPLLTARPDGHYELSSMTLPRMDLDDYPSPVFENQRAAICLCTLPRRGQYQCKNCYLPSPIMNKEEGVPYFLETIMFIETKSEMLDIVMAEQMPTDIQSLLSAFANRFIKTGRCPATILVSDAKTRNLLADFCKQCGISLRVQKHLPLIADAYKVITSRMNRG